MGILEIIGYVGYVAGAIVILTSKTKDDNLKDLKDRVEILEKERVEAKDQHLQNQKAIAHLEGQLSTYKDIPLRGIDESLSKLATSNVEILKTLKKSADIVAKDKKEEK